MEQKVREVINSILTGVSNVSAGYQGDLIRSLAVETVQERAIEMGMGYNIMHNNTLAVDTSDYLLLRTSATNLNTLSKLKVLAIDGSDNKAFYGRINIYEDATVSADGSDAGIVIANFNRNSLNTPDFVIKDAPTVTDEGTLMVSSLISEEILITGTSFQLLPDTDYLIEFYNDSSTSVDFTLDFTIYELELEG